MKKCIKRMLTCVLALAMLLSLAACGSGESDTKTTAAAGSGETAAAGTEESYPTIKVMMSCLTVPKDVAMVEEAVSAITREKIGANVEFIMMEYANQTQQLNLLLSAGDDSIDVFYVKDLATTIANGQGFTAVMVSWMAKFNPFTMAFTSFLIVFLNRGASEISTTFGLNQSFADILTGIILFFIIGCEFFISYKIHFRKKSEKGAEN